MINACKTKKSLHLLLDNISFSRHLLSMHTKKCIWSDDLSRIWSWWINYKTFQFLVVVGIWKWYDRWKGVKPDLVETLLVGHFWSDQIWSSIFGRAHIWSNPYLVQTHIWSEPFLVQPNLVGAIFGPTRFGRCHIWSIQIWLVYT